jgi:hypothetical protein
MDRYRLGKLGLDKGYHPIKPVKVRWDVLATFIKALANV